MNKVTFIQDTFLGKGNYRRHSKTSDTTISCRKMGIPVTSDYNTVIDMSITSKQTPLHLMQFPMAMKIDILKKISASLNIQSVVFCWSITKKKIDNVFSINTYRKYVFCKHYMIATNSWFESNWFRSLPWLIYHGCVRNISSEINRTMNHKYIVIIQ